MTEFKYLVTFLLKQGSLEHEVRESSEEQTGIRCAGKRRRHEHGVQEGNKEQYYPVNSVVSMCGHGRHHSNQEYVHWKAVI